MRRLSKLLVIAVIGCLLLPLLNASTAEAGKRKHYKHYVKRHVKRHHGIGHYGYGGVRVAVPHVGVHVAPTPRVHVAPAVRVHAYPGIHVHVAPRHHGLYLGW